MSPIVVEMHAMIERLFLTKLTNVISFAPSYDFLGTSVLLIRFGTATSYKIKAIPKTPERI